MSRILMFAIVLLAFQSCTKIEYEKKELTYSIEYDSGSEIKKYYFTGNNRAVAKVFEQKVGESHWYDLYVAPYGNIYSILVDASESKIQIISIKDKTISKPN